MNTVLVRLSILVTLLMFAAGTVAAVELVKSEDGKVVGYKDTPKLPWAPEYHKHDPDRPWPADVTPGEPSTQDNPGSAPSDAIVLFDGGGLSEWQPNKWETADGLLVAIKGDLLTKKEFGDCQLHLEWQAPDPPRGPLMNRGNSGIYFMNKYEVQIFDSYSEKIYPDGIAGALYGDMPPMVHPVRKPAEWNIYDIVFTAPVFDGEELVEPARLTMFFNGVLVHFNQEFHGPSTWRILSSYKKAHPAKMPLKLQAHGNPVKFRNIWIRPLELPAE